MHLECKIGNHMNTQVVISSVMNYIDFNNHNQYKSSISYILPDEGRPGQQGTEGCQS